MAVNYNNSGQQAVSLFIYFKFHLNFLQIYHYFNLKRWNKLEAPETLPRKKVPWDWRLRWRWHCDWLSLPDTDASCQRFGARTFCRKREQITLVSRDPVSSAGGSCSASWPRTDRCDSCQWGRQCSVRSRLCRSSTEDGCLSLCTSISSWHWGPWGNLRSSTPHSCCWHWSSLDFLRAH